MSKIEKLVPNGPLLVTYLSRSSIFETHKFFNLYGYRYKINFNLKIFEIHYGNCQNNNCPWRQVLKGLCSNDNRQFAY